jgi:predicted membrane protein
MPDQIEDLNEERQLFEWTGPERSFNRRDRDFWITAIAILVLFAVILIFIKEFFLILTLFSVLFLYYVLSTVPPENIKSKITNRGLYFGEAFYPWTDLYRFWFKKSLSSQTLAIETKLRFPREIDLVIDPKDQEKIKEVMIKRIPHIEESPTFVDKLTKWFANHLPLEKRDKV